MCVSLPVLEFLLNPHVGPGDTLPQLFSRGGHFPAVSLATSYSNTSMCTPYEFNNREKLLLRKLLQTFCPLRRDILLVLKAGN